MLQKDVEEENKSPTELAVRLEIGGKQTTGEGH